MENPLPHILRDKIDEIKYWQNQAICAVYPYRKLYFLAKVNKGTSELVTLLNNMPEDDVLKR
jgi:hypothetical protein